MRESSGPLPANASDPIRIKCESDPACLLGYSCHCEALRVHFQMTRSTSVHIKQIIIGRSLSLPVSRFGLAVSRYRFGMALTSAPLNAGIILVVTV